MKNQTIDQGYQECIRCVMNTNVDKEITFDKNGLCSHCQKFDREKLFRLADCGEGNLKHLVNRIKLAGRGKKYDCIVGISGGTDSTYVALLAKKMGLRPLAIHVDNGWNTELAVSNIEKCLGVLEIDLYTHVIRWSEFKELQVAFLKASTPDGEIPTDHAISAVLWKEAEKRSIKYILSGMNYATESICVPSWSYGHADWAYIKGVHQRFGCGPLKSYPHFSLLDLTRYNVLRGIKCVSILNYTAYEKDKAKKELVQELGWRDYGGKHYESLYTRYFQGYILPNKFGIDKRYGHLSDLINSGQLEKALAHAELQKESYPEELRRCDESFILKKLGLSVVDLQNILVAPAKTFRDYPNNSKKISRVKQFVNYLRKIGWYPK